MGRVPNPQILQAKESTWHVTQSRKLWSVLKRGNMNLSPWLKNVLTNNLDFSMDGKHGRDSEA